MKHIPVLAEDFRRFCESMPEPPAAYLDCTFGRGGHFRILIEDINTNMQADLIDRDLQAIEFGKKEFADLVERGQCRFHHLNFMRLADEASKELAEKKFDLILADLGVSSPQLDQAERGFSFYQEGPLDMRMDASKGIKAADVVNQWDAQEMIELFRDYGEIHNPTKVVNAIITERHNQNIETTTELAELIAKCIGWRKKGQHPATKYFLALRIFVNEELSLLQQSVVDLIARLKENGRLIMITFHSAEDRIVKWTFKEHKEQGQILTKKAVQATWQEKQKNPRARSAIMRVFEKGKL
tara:strand:+ start:2317 stop:3210 length:894 start_codon:yes stop_codon:yes gene_type:complete